MAPERTSSKSKSKVRDPKHQRPARKARPVLSVQEQLQKAWRSIKDQVQDGYPEHALKSVNKLLQLDPSNHLGKQTQLQLLLSLDRYRETLDVVAASDTAGDYRIEQCYALYKLGRMEEAQSVLDAVREEQGNADEGTQRTLDVLDAQIKYRLERFEDAQLLYEDLLATAETDSPEHADLSTNLSAVNAQLEFVSSVPSLLGDIQSSPKPLPSIEHLENTPVASLVSAHRAYQIRANPTAALTAEPTASTSASTSASSTAAKAKRAAKQSKKDAPAKTKKVKLPPSIAALPDDRRPAPDPERWLPKRERSGYAEQLAQRQKEKEKQRLKARKKVEAALTQGAAADEGATSSAAQGQAAGRPQQQQQQGKVQQQQQQQKKKKGKK